MIGMKLFRKCHITIIILLLLFSSCSRIINKQTNKSSTFGYKYREDYSILAQEGITNNDGSSVAYEYLLSDMDSISDIKKGKENFNKIVPKCDTQNFSQLTTDRKKVLKEFVVDDNNVIYRICDDKNNKLFELNVDDSKFFCKFSPQLNYYILVSRNETSNSLLYSVKNINAVRLGYIEDYADLVFSQDENYLGYSFFDEKSGNNIIQIYDLNNAKILCKIKIKGNRNSVYITQIHNSHRVLYMFENNSYIVNFDGTNKKLLGNNIFFPQLSSDGKLLAYAKVYLNQISGYVSFDEEDICPTDERGLYIKDVSTGETKFLEYPDSENEVPVPVTWINNN